MFFILSKLVYWLFMPVSLIAWTAIGSIFVKKEKHEKKVRLVAISLFLFFTNPFLAKIAINSWEPQAVAFNEVKNNYNIGIVLSGITNPNRPPLDRIQFNKGADRIIHAIDLYRLGKINKILISGGNGSLLFEGKKEAVGLRDFALNLGIPQSDIILEDQARNTRENALFSKKLLSEKKQSALLITSAFHMYRAKKCFEKVGLNVEPFPTDHYGQDINFTPNDIIIPSLNGLNIWTILTKEWIGILAYKAAGYI